MLTWSISWKAPNPSPPIALEPLWPPPVRNRRKHWRFRSPSLSYRDPSCDARLLGAPALARKRGPSLQLPLMTDIDTAQPRTDACAFSAGHGPPIKKKKVSTPGASEPWQEYRYR